MQQRFDVQLLYEGRAEGLAPAKPAALTLEGTFGPPRPASPPQGESEAAPAPLPPSRLVRADNLRALTALAPMLAGQVDLIYLDPPFATDANFGAFDDRWQSRAAYLAMLEPRLRLLRTLLSERGSLLVHLDWHMGYLVRALLGEIFGEENSLGEIIWSYGSPSGGRTAGAKLVKAHDVLYWFARKRGGHVYHPQRLPYQERYVRDWFRFVDEDGRRYRKRWRARGQVERQYLDESPGMPLSTVWTDIQQVYADPRAYKANVHSEVTGYPTQKPVALLERILRLTTHPSSLVLDAFCGSGTTAVAAARLGRRFVALDASPRAIHLARKRLLALGAETETPCPTVEVWSEEPPPRGPALVCRASRQGESVCVELEAASVERTDVWSVTFAPDRTLWAQRQRGQLAAMLEHRYTRAEASARPRSKQALIVRAFCADGSASERHLTVPTCSRPGR